MTKITVKGGPNKGIVRATQLIHVPEMPDACNDAFLFTKTPFKLPRGGET